MATASIPNYSLYGDQAQPGWLGMVHFERIHERSSMYEYDIEPHVHDGMVQVLYVTSGGGSVTIDTASWPVQPQTLIVIPARHVHGFHFTADIDGPVVTAAQQPLESIAEVAAPDLLAYIRSPLVLGVSGSARYVDALMPLFEAIEREMRVHVSGEIAAGTSLLMAVFVQIARLSATLHPPEGSDAAARSRKAAQVERFRAMVDKHFREHLPVEHYAAQLGLTPGHLSRLCREVLGVSGLDVINARVVHEAQRELVYSILGIKQIAGVLGFSDETYFGRFFRKHTGQTPTQFRQHARLRLAPDQATRCSPRA